MEGGLVINSIPVGEHPKLDPVSLLGDLGDAVVLEERFLSWPQNFEKQVFSCAIADFQDGVAGAELLPQLVTDMVGCSAFAGCPADRACTPRPDQQSSVDMLVSADLAEFVGEQRNRLRFTSKGMRNLQQHWNLDDPVRVCSRQPDLAIADCTLHELLCRLRDQDWQWHRWTGSRAQRLGYTAGSPKHWFTTGSSPAHSYLQVLLRAEELAHVIVHNNR